MCNGGSGGRGRCCAVTAEAAVAGGDTTAAAMDEGIDVSCMIDMTSSASPSDGVGGGTCAVVALLGALVLVEVGAGVVLPHKLKLDTAGAAAVMPTASAAGTAAGD